MRERHDVKGVILAGGLGTRLLPLTRITNKHLLPVFDKPMIFYPIQCLVNAGITDIMIVTGGNFAGHFLQLLGNGNDFGLKDLHYTYQQGEGGIADALKLAEHFAEGEKVVVVLGDNIIESNIKKAADDFRRQDRGAKILLKEVPDPERFGVATMKGGKVEKIVDTTSAGDSFNGSFLARYVATGDAVAAARFAADVAASVIQHHGALVTREKLPG